MDIAWRSCENYSAEALAREMLAHAAKIRPEDIVFYRGKNGKPMTELPLYFNCSHSGQYVVCAVSHREIGVDLERIRPVNRRMERTLTPRERQWLLSLPAEDWDREFLRLWTLKESWIKCRSGTVMEYKQGEFVLEMGRLLQAPAGFSFSFPPAPAGYVATVCERV